MSAIAKAAERWGSAGVAEGGNEPKAANWQTLTTSNGSTVSWVTTSVPFGVDLVQPPQQGA